ncbi:amidase [Gemmata sp. JC717]|uniref:amidase n=1 Tax=Gemmata algarum TaxID=2975278 RepID=UPI0021BAE5CB|nr:amidase [Gemmata algarum]MDY3555044.1 amidase [Gemmata algarum]
MPEPLTITDAAGFIRTGELTPADLLEQCLARIDRYEDRVRAWVHIDRDGAREQAARLTAELKQNNYRGPLHGIPVGIKDIIDVFDMPTGCGSKRWAQSYARRDATCVERLRQAGAVILGKTVTTAYASFDPPVTRNPWNLDRTPGGSSSGSAAAVACGMCLGALATQTGGSITRPASYCGVYSLKPTHSRVSVDGVLPLAPSLDHIGVMANCVNGLAWIFETIAGRDPRDPASAGERVPDLTYAPLTSPDPQRIAVLGGMFHERTAPVLREQIASHVRTREGIGGLATTTHGTVPIDVMKSFGTPLPAEFGEVTRRHTTVMAVEAAAYHAPRLARYPDDYPPNVTALLREGLNTPAPEYANCKAHQERLSRLCDALFDHYDALLTPATTGAAPTSETTGNPVFNSPWSYVGLPTVSLPFAWSPEGLPLSVQLIGPRFGEAQLFGVAARWEADIAFERRPLPL